MHAFISEYAEILSFFLTYLFTHRTCKILHYNSCVKTQKHHNYHKNILSVYLPTRGIHLIESISFPQLTDSPSVMVDVV